MADLERTQAPVTAPVTAHASPEMSETERAALVAEQMRISLQLEQASAVANSSLRSLIRR